MQQLPFSLKEKLGLVDARSRNSDYVDVAFAQIRQAFYADQAEQINQKRGRPQPPARHLRLVDASYCQQFQASARGVDTFQGTHDRYGDDFYRAALLALTDVVIIKQKAKVLRLERPERLYLGTFTCNDFHGFFARTSPSLAQFAERLKNGPAEGALRVGRPVLTLAHTTQQQLTQP